MKKTLLAAALVAGFAGAAQAETSVTLYGIIDTGIGYQQLKGSDGYKATRFGVINGVQSGSRWGMKGSEDLGNGLHAVFQLESGFDSSTGNSAQGGRLFGRQATVGLAGDSWGELDLGRQTNIASKYLGGVIDPFGNGFAQANLGESFTSANTLRYDNMILYQTPNFSGFQFGLGYAFNASGNQAWKISGQNDKNNRAITTGLRYANGPISAALTYDRFDNDSIDGGAVNEWNIGAAYDFEVVKVSLGFGQTRNGLFQTQGAGFNNADSGSADYGVGSDAMVKLDGLKVNSYLVGLSAPIGNGKILASWQMADPGSSYTGDLKKQQAYSLGYTYNLSKRTNLYAIGSYATHQYFSDNLKSTAIGVGVRHMF
ncbi:porin [Candidimonas humi]|jgi:predicted porin|uniref:Porin n=1 Tax=Candidimonas humi TaxID=683355 RepID=A0ABV8NY78_9BURK|nr:porin [Candidimonas humi]MBV6305157.1 porin [Candidimonas humi]